MILLNMIFDLKTRRVELLAEPKGSMLLRSNRMINFDEDLVHSEIHGKSPFIRGNKLWNQLSCEIQHVKTKLEFTRMLTDNIIQRLVNK